MEVTVFNMNPSLSEEDMKKPAGFVLPDSISQNLIVKWFNERRQMLQYNDCDAMIVDSREEEDVPYAFSTDQQLSDLPKTFTMTHNLFQIFCDYFKIQPKLNKIRDNQSIAIVSNNALPWIMAFPYFRNVNYHHCEIFDTIPLRTLMEYQDQALQLRVSLYPFDMDRVVTTTTITVTQVQTRQRKRSFSQIDKDEDEMNCEDIQKSQREETWQPKKDQLEARITIKDVYYTVEQDD